MNKKFIEIKANGKPIYVATVVDGTSEDFIKAKKEAEENLHNLIEIYYDDLIKRIDDLENEVKILKGEI